MNAWIVRIGVRFCVWTVIAGMVSNAAARFAVDAGTDPVYELYHVVAQRHPREAALGGAGCARLDNVAASVSNPACAHADFIYSGDSSVFEVDIGGGRSVLSDDHLLAAAMQYRFGGAATSGITFSRGVMRRPSVHTVQRGRINTAARFFPHTISRGPIDAGLQCRMAHFTRHSPAAESLWSVSFTEDGPDTVWHAVMQDSVQVRHTQIGVDIGIFQREIAPHVDFGFTITNLVGYTWHGRDPRLRHTDGLHTSGGDTILTDTLRYARGDTVYTGWVPGQYRSVTGGVCLRKQVQTGSVPLEFELPVDVTATGLFTREHIPRFFFRAGVQAMLHRTFFVRMGYAYAPVRLDYRSYSTRNHTLAEHALSGGLGMMLDAVGMDVYVGKKTFALHVRYRR